MYNATMVNYGSDFLVYGNEVYLSHQFSMQYLNALMFVFMMGVFFGLGASLFYTASKEELVPLILEQVKKRL